jgi:RHS repeat-associated protein
VTPGATVASTKVFTYDSRDRIKSLCYSVTVPCPAGQGSTWTYDPNSNIATSAEAGVATSYVYDTADQLSSSTTGAVTSTYAYDLNGNMSSINDGVGAVGTRTVGDFDFTYNFANQTVTVKDGANITTSFAYDAMSNRSSATTGAVVNRFVWDKQNGLAQLAFEKDGGTNSVTRRYVYGFDVISESAPDTTSFYSTDDIGTVTNVTAQAGNSQWAYDFTPFGKDKTASKIDPAALVNPLKFTGQYQDPSSQYHLRARQYIPSIGRFTQTDPMPYGPGSAFEGSYVYGMNRPGVMTDPSGLRALLAGISVPQLCWWPFCPVYVPGPYNPSGRRVPNLSIPESVKTAFTIGLWTALALNDPETSISLLTPALFNEAVPAVPKPRAPVTDLPRDQNGNIIGGTGAGKGDALSAAEAQAVKDFEAGLTPAVETLASARAKLRGQEKFQGKRNSKKQRRGGK